MIAYTQLLCPRILAQLERTKEASCSFFFCRYGTKDRHSRVYSDEAVRIAQVRQGCFKALARPVVAFGPKQLNDPPVIDG